MKRIITIITCATFLFVSGCASLPQGESDPQVAEQKQQKHRNVIENTRGWCFLSAELCPWVLGIGAVGALVILSKSDKKSAPPPATPAPTPTTPAPTEPTMAQQPTVGKIGVIIDSDIAPNGQQSDKDDQQAFLLAMGMFNDMHIEGLISTSNRNNDGDRAFKEIINNDYRNRYNASLSGKGYPSPDYLDSVVYKGSRVPQATMDPQLRSDGALMMVEKSRTYNKDNKLNVLVWGPISTVAEAVAIDNGIKARIRVFFIGSTNRVSDQAAFNYLYNRHPDLEVFWDDDAFRGFFLPGGGRVYSTQDSMDQWVRDNIFSVPDMGPAWQRYPIHGPEWQFRVKAGDYPTLLYLMQPKYQQVFVGDNGNWRKATEIKFLRDRRQEIWDQFVKPRIDRLR